MPACRHLVRSFVAALCLAAACAASAQEAAGVRIYQVGEIAYARYTVLGRIWVDSWRSAFFVPTHEDESGAIAALRDEAAQRGADGIVNLRCLNDSGGLPLAGGYFCYANAIKLK